MRSIEHANLDLFGLRIWFPVKLIFLVSCDIVGQKS
jgi:hypothetical protein